MEAYTPTGEAPSSPDLHTLLDRLLDEVEGVEEGGGYYHGADKRL